MTWTSTDSQPLSAFGPARLWLIAVVSLLAGTVRADGPPGPSPSEAVLSLTDGGFLHGSLDDSNRSGKLRWKSSVFLNPLDFDVKAVHAIRFPTPEKLPRPTGDFGFETTGGDIFYGSILSLDDKSAELDIASLGRITLDRSRLRRIFRWQDGADLVFNGPNGMAGWREIPPSKRKKPEGPQRVQAAVGGMAVFNVNVAVNGAAQAPQVPPIKPVVPPIPAWTEEGGQLVSNKQGATIEADIELPAKSSLEIDLSWKKTPDFALIIGFNKEDDSLDRAFRFEVWDKDIVLYRVEDQIAKLVSVQQIHDGPGRMQVQLFLDKEQGRLLVFSASGDPLGEINLPGRPGQAINGIRLVNLRGDIRLERLRIGKWDGETPRPLGNDLSRILLTDQSSIRGRVERLDSMTHEFIIKGESGETRIAEDQVSNIFLAQAEDRTPRAVHAVFQDGTRISGDWTRVEGGSLVVTSPGIASSVKLPMNRLSSLDLSPSDETSTRTGWLEMDGVRLIGRLVKSGDRPDESALVWSTNSSESSSPLQPGASGRIIYKIPVPQVKPNPAQRAAAQQAAAQRARVVPQQPNLIGGFVNALQNTPRQPSSQRRSLYLRSGDIIPAEVLSIDEKGMTFKTDLSKSNFVPHSRIKAVEMAVESASSIRINKTKFERLLTLPRVQRDSPPTHLIRSKNGDMLRARIVSMDDRTIRLEIRLEEKEISRDRVSRIIWLHADESDPTKKPAEAAGPVATNRVQAVRSDGIRLTFNAEGFADDTLTGKSDVLGECKVKLADLETLLIGGWVEKEAVQVAYQNWKLQNAPDPRSAQDEVEGPESDGTESPLVGKPAPDFELDLIGGQKFHLAENKGKVIVLDFWATWCGPCIQAMPELDRVIHEFADQGVQLISVNLEESPEKIKRMLERLKLDPTVALDREGIVARRYAANAIPQTVIIDRDGKITRVFIGAGPKFGDRLREALQAVMPKEKP
jgi:thiol-disulfide isomerase/thioredoxin